MTELDRDAILRSLAESLDVPAELMGLTPLGHPSAILAREAEVIARQAADWWAVHCSRPAAVTPLTTPRMRTIMSSPTMDPVVLATALAVELRQALTGLNEYIERRAAELAEPLIAEVQRKAAEEVAEAQREAQRHLYVKDELRRMLDVRDRQLDDLRAAATPLTEPEEQDRG